MTTQAEACDAATSRGRRGTPGADTSSRARTEAPRRLWACGPAAASGLDVRPAKLGGRALSAPVVASVAAARGKRHSC